MLDDAGPVEDFFRELLGVAVADISNFLMPGVGTAAFLLERGVFVCAKAAYKCLRSRSRPQQRRDIDSVTRIPPDRSRDLVEEAVGPYHFDAETRRDLVNYLSVIPMTFRRAITRPDDGGRPATLLSQLPRGPEDLRRFMPLRLPRFAPGDRVPGYDYELELLLGQGGFGEVWKARHTLQATRPAVALKFCLEPELLVSLKREIQVYEELQGHTDPQHLVQLLETAYSADPPFLVYEYVAGGDLAGWLADFGGKPPSLANVVRVLKMTARALAFAHERGIVHRDLKPQNLLITREGSVKVTDFGIGAIMAQAGFRPEENGGVTGTTVLREAYTPMYSDPRQRLGGRPEANADVFALGVIAYQLLVADVTQAMDLAWRTELEERRVPAGVLDLIASCVEVPARRLADAGELLAALGELDRRQTRKRPKVPVINYCIHCGHRAPPEDSFCIRCGGRIR